MGDFKTDARGLISALEAFDWDNEQTSLSETRLPDEQGMPRFSPGMDRLLKHYDRFQADHLTSPEEPHPISKLPGGGAVARKGGGFIGTGGGPNQRTEPWNKYMREQFPQFKRTMRAQSRQQKSRLRELGHTIDWQDPVRNVVGTASYAAVSAVSGATAGLVDPRKTEGLKRSFRPLTEEHPRVMGIAGGVGELSGEMLGPLKIGLGLAKNVATAGARYVPRVAEALSGIARASTGRGAGAAVTRMGVEGARMGFAGGMVGAAKETVQQGRILLDEGWANADLGAIPEAAMHDFATWGTLGGMSTGMHGLLGKYMANWATPMPQLTNYIRRAVNNLAGAGLVSGFSAASAEAGQRAEVLLDSFITLGLVGAILPGGAAKTHHNTRMRERDLDVGAAFKQLTTARLKLWKVAGKKAAGNVEEWAAEHPGEHPERVEEIRLGEQALQAAKDARSREYSGYEESQQNPSKRFEWLVEGERKRHNKTQAAAKEQVREHDLDRLETKALLLEARQRLRDDIYDGWDPKDSQWTSRVMELSGKLDTTAVEIRQLELVANAYALEAHSWMEWAGNSKVKADGHVEGDPLVQRRVYFMRFEAAEGGVGWNAVGMLPNGKRVRVPYRDVKLPEMELPANASQLQGMPNELVIAIGMAAARDKMLPGGDVRRELTQEPVDAERLAEADPNNPAQQRLPFERRAGESREDHIERLRNEPLIPELNEADRPAPFGPQLQPGRFTEVGREGKNPQAPFGPQQEPPAAPFGPEQPYGPQEQPGYRPPPTGQQGLPEGPGGAGRPTPPEMPEPGAGPPRTRPRPPPGQTRLELGRQPGETQVEYMDRVEAGQAREAAKAASKKRLAGAKKGRDVQARKRAEAETALWDRERTIENRLEELTDAQYEAMDPEFALIQSGTPKAEFLDRWQAEIERVQREIPAAQAPEPSVPEHSAQRGRLPNEKDKKQRELDLEHAGSTEIVDESEVRSALEKAIEGGASDSELGKVFMKAVGRGWSRGGLEHGGEGRIYPDDLGSGGLRISWSKGPKGGGTTVLTGARLGRFIRAELARRPEGETAEQVMPPNMKAYNALVIRVEALPEGARDALDVKYGEEPDFRDRGLMIELEKDIALHESRGRGEAEAGEDLPPKPTVESAVAAVYETSPLDADLWIGGKTMVVPAKGPAEPAKYALRPIGRAIPAHRMLEDFAPEPRSPPDIQPRGAEHAKAIRFANELHANPEKAAHYINTSPSPTEGPAGIDPEAGFNIWGNARTESLIDAHRQRGQTRAWDNYQKYLKDHIEEFGLEASDIDGTQELVRVTDRPLTNPDVWELRKSSNFTTTENMSILDRAAHLTLPEDLLMAVGQNPDATFAEMVAGKAGRRIVERIKSSLPDAELPLYFNREGGAPTPEGKRLIEATMLARSVPRDVVEMLQETPARIDMLRRAIPQLTELSRPNVPPEWDLRPALWEAFRVRDDLPDPHHPYAWDNRFSQPALPGMQAPQPPTPQVLGLLRWMTGPSGGRPTELRNALKKYLHDMHSAGAGTVQGLLIAQKGDPVASARIAFGQPFEGAGSMRFVKPAEAGMAVLPDLEGVKRAARRVWAALTPNTRRDLTRAHGGNAERAEMDAAHTYQPAIRDQVEEVFRQQARPQIMRQMETDDVPELLRRATTRMWRGQSLEEIRDALMPEGTLLQAGQMVRQAALEAIAAGGSAAVPWQYSAEGLAEITRQRDAAVVTEAQRPAYLQADLLDAVRARKAQGKRPKGLNLVQKYGWDLYGRSSFELGAAADRDIGQMHRETTELLNVKRRINKLLNRVGGLPTTFEVLKPTAIQRLRGKTLVLDAAQAAFDVWDGLRRGTGTPQSEGNVARFVQHWRRQLNAELHGKGDDWAEAARLGQEIYNRVDARNLAWTGQHLSGSIAEWQYAPHMFGDARGQAHNFDALPEWFKNTMDRKQWIRFAEQRAATATPESTGYIPDAMGTLDAYLQPMLRKIWSDGMTSPKSDMGRALYGTYSSFSRGLGIGKKVLGNVFGDGGELLDNDLGQRMIRAWEMVPDRRASAATKNLALRVSRESLHHMKDAEGNSVLDSLRAGELEAEVARLEEGSWAQTVAQGDLARTLKGSEFMFRDSRGMQPGDTTFKVRLMPGDGREIEIPFLSETGESNLAAFSLRRGGLLELAREGSPDRMVSAERAINKIKTGSAGSETLDSINRAVNKYTRWLRSSSYAYTLGLLNPRPAMDNWAGGMIMLVNDVGLDSGIRSLERYRKAMMGGDPALREAIERSGIHSEPGLGTEEGMSLGSARSAFRNVQFSLFRGAERHIRGPSFVAGYLRSSAHSEAVHKDFVEQHGLEPGDSIVRMGRKVYRERFVPDGRGGGERVVEQLEGDAEAFISTLDPTKPTMRRRIYVDQLPAEREALGDIMGRYTVAKTQFNYNVGITPELFGTPLGQAAFQLNQWPIRALHQFMQIGPWADGRDDRKFARWWATTAALSTITATTAYDFASSFGIRPSDLGTAKDSLYLQDDYDPQAKFHEQGGMLPHILRSSYLPVAAPMSQGFIPAWYQQGKAALSLLFSAFGTDSTNLVPVDPTLANHIARVYSAFTNLPRKEQSLIIPKLLLDLGSFMGATPDPETGKVPIRFGPGQSEVYQTTAGEMLRETFLPGTAGSKYDFIRRQRVGRLKEQQAGDASGRAKEFEVEGSLTPEERGSSGFPFVDKLRAKLQPAFAENAAAIREEFNIEEMTPRELERRKNRAGLPGEVVQIRGYGLVRRMPAFTKWLLTERPGPTQALESIYHVFGESSQAWKSNLKEIRGRLGDSEGTAVLQQINALRRKLSRAKTAGAVNWEEIETLLQTPVGR